MWWVEPGSNEYNIREHGSILYLEMAKEFLGHGNVLALNILLGF